MRYNLQKWVTGSLDWDADYRCRRLCQVENGNAFGLQRTSQGYFPVPQKETRARIEEGMQWHLAQFSAPVTTTLTNQNMILSDDDTTKIITTKSTKYIHYAD